MKPDEDCTPRERAINAVLDESHRAATDEVDDNVSRGKRQQTYLLAAILVELRGRDDGPEWGDYGVDPNERMTAELMRAGQLSFTDEPRQGSFTPTEPPSALIHRVCPVFEDCEGYETSRHDAIGPLVIHLRERHGEWYEKFARQAAHDNETE